MTRNELTKMMAGLTPAMRAASIRAAEIAGSESEVLTKKRVVELVRTIPKEQRGDRTQAAAVDLVSRVGREIAGIRVARLRERRVDTIQTYSTRAAEAKEAQDRRRLACRLAVPLEQRLKQAREEAVIRAAKVVMNWGAPAGTEWRIRLSVTGEIGYELTTWRDYDVYRGQYKGWAANGDRHSITVRPDWKTRVTRAGCNDGLLNGSMLLDAEVVNECVLGTWALFRTSYAERGRGYQANVSKGILVRLGRRDSGSCKTKLFTGDDFTKPYKLVGRFVRGKVKVDVQPIPAREPDEAPMPVEDLEALLEFD